MNSVYWDISAMNRRTRRLNTNSPWLWLMHNDDFFGDLNDDPWGSWTSTSEPMGDSVVKIEWNW